MHRINGRRHSLLWGTLLALLISGLAGLSQAQNPPSGSAVIVPLYGSTVIQMSTKKPIKKAVATREGIINIRPVNGDPSKIMLYGLTAETTPLELTDEDNKTETYLVTVQRDIENLRVRLRSLVPTGNVVPEPISETTVALNGTVSRAADTLVLQQAAEALGFRVINNVTVGGVQQVQLDVVVALVSRSAFRSMAFDFLADSKNFYFGSVGSGAVGTPGSAGGSSTGAVGGAGAPIGPASLGLSGTIGTPGGVPTNLLFGVVHNGYNLLGFLQALRAENLVKTMAEPRLITLSGQPASFLSGGEQAIPVPAGLGQVGVQFEEFGVRLNFLPIVLGNGRIHLEVEPEVSSLDAANGVNIQGTVVPGRDTNRVHTTVQMDVGHTFVIGGLIQHTVTASDDKVPVLGDLPYLGAMFRRMTYQDQENEVLILVTPHLVEAFDCAQAPKVLPGQETRSPDDYELFLEGILEAPRGQRCVFQDGCYVPAYKNSPSASVYPCGDRCGGGIFGANGCGANGCNGSCAIGSCGTGSCGTGSCANGSCGAAPRPPAPIAMPAVQVAPQALPVVVPQTTPVSMAPLMMPSDTSAMVPPAAEMQPRPVPQDLANQAPAAVLMPNGGSPQQ